MIGAGGFNRRVEDLEAGTTCQANRANGLQVHRERQQVGRLDVNIVGCRRICRILDDTLDRHVVAVQLDPGITDDPTCVAVDKQCTFGRGDLDRPKVCATRADEAIDQYVVETADDDVATTPGRSDGVACLQIDAGFVGNDVRSGGDKDIVIGFQQAGQRQGVGRADVNVGAGPQGNHVPEDAAVVASF